MRAPPSRTVIRGARAAFTLLELLFVVLILCIVGAGAVLITDSVQGYVSEELVQCEVRAVRDALLRFKDDTGFMPKCGPFALVLDGGRVPCPDVGRAWFDCPANLCQLFECPRDAAGDPIMPWNADTGRGWRGPYLRRDGEGLVDIGAGLRSDGAGSPLRGALLPLVPAVADPFECRAVSGPGGSYLRWHAWGDLRPVSGRGAPYLVFDLGEPQRTRLVSLGPNGLYEAVDPTRPGDDVVLFLFR
jgi:prepilin-type N-terminal cleavage/methylation domain-containing protein